MITKANRIHEFHYIQYKNIDDPYAAEAFKTDYEAFKLICMRTSYNFSEAYMYRRQG